MKSVKIMMIAFAAVAALCITPLFIAVDTDAVIIEEGSTGLSFKVDSLTNTNTDKLFTSEDKNTIAMAALATATGQSTSNVSTYWTLSEIKVTEMKNLKTSLGTEVTGDHMEKIRGSGLECKVSFKATVKAYYNAPLFSNNDGTQTLYEFIGSRYAPSDSTLDVSGTFTLYSYQHSSTDYFKNKDNKGCLEKTIVEETRSLSFSGDLTYTVNSGGAEKVRNYSVDAKSSFDNELTNTYDYGNTNKSDVKESTRVFIKSTYNKLQEENKFEYNTKDNTNGGYSYSFDRKFTTHPTYITDYAEDYLVREDEPLTEYHYYGTDGNTCLFTSADPELCDDSKMESFLTGLSGSTVSESYTDAKTVADSTYTHLSVGSDGKNNFLVLYIIIGVLAVVIVLLVILMLRKKKEPKQEDQ